MFNRRRPQADFSQELQAHLALEIDRLRNEGCSEEEVLRQAHRSVGNLASAGERFYESTRWLWLEHLAQDSRQALRRLRKTPAFSITAILTLALGIGATTSIFTLVHAVLLKSLPVSNPAQLYRVGDKPHCCVWGGYQQGDEFSIVSYELYQRLRDHTAGFEELAAFQAGGIMLGVRRELGHSPSQPYFGEFVSGNYFAMFGVPAYAGRTVTTADDQPGAAPAAMMSYRVWEQKYAFDRSVIGSSFIINDKPFTVVGVTPPGFYGDTLRNTPPDFFLALATEPLLQGDRSMLHEADRSWLDVIGRVKAGASPQAIEAQMRVELQQWLRSHEGDMRPDDRAKLTKQTLHLTPGGAGITSMRRDYERWLRILMAVSGFVLLIVCMNVANLMLVRGVERWQETSLSMALGARPGRLVRQALTESVILSLLGGAAGLAVAFAGTRLILHLAFQFTMASQPTGSPIRATPSWPVLAFAFGVSLISGIAAGLAPAWMATRANPVEALRGANRATRRAGSLPRKTLVILQAALSLVLLSASGLLTATLRNLEHQNLGFAQERRTVVTIEPSLAGYKPAQLHLLYRRMHDALSAIPGVESVAACLYSPQSGDNWNDLIFLQGQPQGGDMKVAVTNRVTPGFFETIGNRIVKGRSITEQDTASSQRVAVVNETFAKKFFGAENPIGKHFGNAEATASGEYEIVGVAQDARYLTGNPEEPVPPQFVVAEAQSAVFVTPANTAGEVRSHFLHDVVILIRPGATLSVEQVSAAMAGIDPNLPVAAMQTMTHQVAGNFSQERLIAQLTSLFGMLALVLASIGLYGVTAYNVGSRTNEIGLRMALGADRRDVLKLILRGAMTLIGLGLLIGVPLTLLACRFLGTQLYGINAYDPRVMAGAVIALGCAALIAALIPAVRASSISPLRALRSE